MTKIVTQLDKTAVVAALHELAPSAHNSKLFRSTFEGQIDPQRILIGYRLGWFVPPIRLVTFEGHARENGDNTVIHGETSSGWVFYLVAVWLLVAAPLSIYRAVSESDYFAVGWAVLTAVFLFIFGRVFVRSTQEYVISEIGRAVRGKVADG